MKLPYNVATMPLLANKYRKKQNKNYENSARNALFLLKLLAIEFP